MFQAIRKWWHGLWEKEESPGPKITKDGIARVKETIDEMRSGSFDRAKPTGTEAECMAAVAAGQQRPFKREHGEPEKEKVKGREIKFATSSHVTIQRGVDGPVETEIVNGVHRTITRDNVIAHVDGQGNLLPLRGMDHDGHMDPPDYVPQHLLASAIAIGAPLHFKSLEDTVAERLEDPKPVRVELDELNADTAVPAQRKPRRRGKRGGVKRNNRSKKK